MFSLIFVLQYAGLFLFKTLGCSQGQIGVLDQSANGGKCWDLSSTCLVIMFLYLSNQLHFKIITYIFTNKQKNNNKKQKQFI